MNRVDRRAALKSSRRYFKHLATLPQKLRDLRANEGQRKANERRLTVLGRMVPLRELMDTVALEFLDAEERKALAADKASMTKAINTLRGALMADKADAVA
jgi:hypothetical protein